MKILWLSRHWPLSAQRDALRRLFPHCEIVVDSDTFGDVNDVVGRIKASGAHEVVIIAPLGLVQLLVERGIRPLWPEMRECTPESARLHPAYCISAPRGRCFEFIRFRRLTLSFSELEVPCEIQTASRS